MVSTVQPVATVVVHDRTVGFRRVAGALALPLGFAAQLICVLAYSLATMSGGDDTSGSATLALARTHPDLILISSLAALVGAMLMVPGVLALLRLLRAARSRLSLVAGILVIAGYLCYAVINGNAWLVAALARLNVDAAAAIDASMASLSGIPFFLTFVVGNLLGMALLGVCVLLTRGLPRFAGALLLAWPVFHVIGLTAGTEWFEVVGATLQTIGGIVLAAVMLRMTNAEWARRG